MGHTYTQLLVHAIFSTKHREPSIRDDFRARLFAYMADRVNRDFGHAVIVGGVADHLHALLRLRPDVALADLMEHWKSHSSGWVHRTFPRTSDFAWQIGYAAFSVSPSRQAQVVACIRNQQEHHRHVSFQDEYLTFLKRHGIDYDPRYVFD